MIRIFLITFCCLLMNTRTVFAQSDVYSGIWKAELLSDSGSSAIKAELMVGVSEKNILFPAQLVIRCDEFMGVYQLLLARKSIRELGISKNKYKVSEAPFSMGIPCNYLTVFWTIARIRKGSQH